MAPGDLDLLGLGVAREADDLEAVLQGVGDAVQRVGGGDEEDGGQVEVDIEIVVGEVLVLFRVQDLEEGRGGDRRGSRTSSCRLRREGRRGCGSRPSSSASRSGRAGRRCRCDDDPGSPLRHGRRRGRSGRRDGRCSGRSSGRATSCPRRAARRSTGSVPWARPRAAARQGTRECAP